MSSSLGATLESVRRQERRLGVRLLLRQPLLMARHDADGFDLVIRHRDWLERWFAEQTGWTLVVDSAAGFARLHKIPARVDGSHGAGGKGRPAFDVRRYTLLCLTLAALDDSPLQTTLVRLADLIGELSAEEPQIPSFDPAVFGERRALVDVLRYLVELGVLTPRDGDEERYVRDQQGDALYDVNDRLLSQLVSTPRPPVLSRDCADMLREAYADTEEGKRRRARHRVFRALVDEPVVYFEELAELEYQWLDHSRGFVYEQLDQAVGLTVERRQEGMAAVDAEGFLSDELFPDGGSTAKHAALLLAEQLTARQKKNPGQSLRQDEIEKTVALLIADYGQRCHWSKRYLDSDTGAARLAGDAMELLEQFGLAKHTEAGWQARPAITRFAPGAPGDGHR
jgi:uncharacterized protein (TIGR02678 family)